MGLNFSGNTWLELTLAVAQMVGGKVGSTALVSECRAAQVQTVRAASTTVHPSLVPSSLVSLEIAPERSEMNGLTAAAVELVGLMLRSTTLAAKVRAAKVRSVRAADSIP